MSLILSSIGGIGFAFGGLLVCGLGTLASLALFAATIFGLVTAIRGLETPIPVIGDLFVQFGTLLIPD